MAEAVPPANPSPEMSFQRSDFMLILALLILAGGMHVWLLTHTEVAARDSIGFIRIALAFETQPWAAVVDQYHQHPLYPLSVLVASWPVRFWQGGGAPTPETMLFSAQLASGLAGWLLVVPMFFLGKRLFSRSVGFWAALLFQVLPVSGHILSDGLSEALFLLLTAISVLLADRALTGGSPLRFGLCGLSCGFTYLTRPEGGLLVLAVLGALLLFQMRRQSRLAWKGVGLRATLLLLGATLAGSPYVAATGRLTNKPSANQLLAGDGFSAVTGEKSLFAVVLPTSGPLPERCWKGLVGLGTELAKGFHYIAWLPALLGLWWYRRRSWVVPAMLVMEVLCFLHALVLWRLVVVVGYLSDRHALLLVMCGLYPAVAALHEIPVRLVTLVRQGLRAGLAAGGWPMFQRASIGALVLLLGLTGAAMPKTLQRLHANRAGHHAAGKWLAQHFQPGDEIDDDHAWAHFYAGCVFREGQPPLNPRPASAKRYVVISRKIDPDSAVAKLRTVSEEKLKTDGGQLVFHWPTRKDVQKAEVVVYALDLSRDSLPSPKR